MNAFARGERVSIAEYYRRRLPDVPERDRWYFQQWAEVNLRQWGGRPQLATQWRKWFDKWVSIRNRHYPIPGGW